MYLLLCYDISGNARRQQLHTRLKAFLRPVQKSVFEGPLDDRRYRDLLRLVHRFVQHEVDSVRIYRLCGTCTHAMTLIGTAVPVPDGPEDVFV
ncbi:MAG: CRISPR-associated endonuclease Cas2 [Myxococcales bacterium]|nr:CRISPR-associated endonuclease Cas2 [Myxococcales bacterium]MCB9548971.1 CRISPR-associated endonuclease Cas2 [Myxococcales bacterium]